jgi:vancomycin resistance protein VanJ
MQLLKRLSALYIIVLTFYIALRFTVGDGFWWLSLLNTFAFLLFIPLPLALMVVWVQKTKWLRLLSLVPTLVALAWFGTYFLPKPPRDLFGQPLTVLTYNMRAQDETFESFLRQHQPDIVFLQETSSNYSQLVSSITDLYPYQFNQSEEWGNTVLSKYPVLRGEDLQGFGSSLPQRLELDVNGQTIAVYNVHFTWPIGNPRLQTRFLPGFIAKAISGFDDTPRNTQLDMLANYLEAETLPFIVAGDFNLSQYSATYDKFSKVARDSFRDTAIGFGNTWPATLQSGLHLPPLLRLDYIWHGVHFKAADVQRQEGLGSDHFPVLSRLVLEDLPVSNP